MPRRGQSPLPAQLESTIWFSFSFNFRQGGPAQAPAISFISQGLDWIEQRRLASRVIAEEHAYGNRKECRYHHGFERHLRLPMQSLPHQIRTKNSKEHSQRSAYQAEHDRFAQELQLNRLFCGANRHANANLSRAFRNGN